MEFHYGCSICNKTFDIVPELTLCPDCSKNQQPDQPLSGVLEVKLSGSTHEDFTIADLLPVEPEYFPPSPVGNTPLWKPANLRQQTGFKNLFIKDDGLNPTSSFKDRASFLVSAFAKKFNINDITLASTGNAGSSMAGIGAAAGQAITLFLPKTAPVAKLVQALQYGATVFRVDGNYDMAYDLSLAYSQKKGGMNRNTAYNPMTIEGKKTVSLELFKQLDQVPDMLFVSVGDGCILAGVYKGFRDLKQLGLIRDIPKIVAVQAQTSDALFRAYTTGKFENIPTATVADSICVDVPRNGIHALAQIKQYNGEVMTVSDDEIIQAQASLSRTTGLFTEPAGAASFAGFLKAAPGLDPDALIVVLTTGNGLKDSVSASLGIRVPDTLIHSVDDIL
ncbi:MAG: threonine synthase [Desulfobacula sp.]|uniref:threonine synthase n=1 Tax=Desulfobacula sp. TaxID=2593537 RepID=UPI0025C361E7|nr:threonine synthase [Desulfobacula sp.]MCD4722923.1 threonine synthase [Desulfobacula sp.]